MRNSPIDKVTVRYPNENTDGARSRGRDDLQIKVLELEASEDDIRWKVLQGTALSDKTIGLDEGHEGLELNYLTRETIDVLAEQLRLLADISPTLRDEALKVKISNTEDRLIKILGLHLYNVLFKGSAKEQLEDVLDELDRRTLDLLRVELKLEYNRLLAGWPWDCLYRPLDEAGDGEFLNRSAQLVLNRRLNVRRRSLQTPPPVKVLLVVSSPQDRMLGKVQCELVLREIRKLQQEHVVTLYDLIEKLEFTETYQPTVTGQAVTGQEFRKVLAEFKPNIIHLIGHGRWTYEGEQIAFVKGGGRPDWVSDEEFANWVAQCKDLKLVFLQVCESARVAPYGMGMAVRLAHRNIPAVIAMQDKVENEIASTFACGFYDALASGLSVDQAVKAGQDAVDAHGHARHALGTPVLYLSSYEGLIVPENPPDRHEVEFYSDPAPRYACPHCDTLIAVKSMACGTCGLRLYCGFCNQRLKGKEALENYCINCGQLLRCKQCRKQYRDNTESLLCPICRSLKGAAEVGEPVALPSGKMGQVELRQ